MSRTSLLTAAFRDVQLTLGPHTLRPLTAGSMMLLMESNNPLFTGSANSEIDEYQGIFAYAWMHIAPVDEVIATVTDPAALRLAATRLAMETPFEALEDFSEQFRALRDRIDAATTIPVDEKNTPGKPVPAMPSPTGSPASSTTSEATTTPPASDGSSGPSHSSAPSNTSTPPPPRTDPDSAGPSRIWEETPPRPDPPPQILLP